MSGNSSLWSADRRGQSYVLEAIGAGVIVLAAVMFAIQATAVTPLSASTANKHIENQERYQADTLLDHTARDGSLKDAILYWDPVNGTFIAGNATGYRGDIADPPPNAFLEAVDRVFSDSQIAVNIYLTYTHSVDSTNSKRLLYQGTPSDNAVSANHIVVLYDHDRLTAPDSNSTLNSTDGFYARNVDPDSSIYNIVEVRIVVWRM